MTTRIVEIKNHTPSFWNRLVSSIHVLLVLITLILWMKMNKCLNWNLWIAQIHWLSECVMCYALCVMHQKQHQLRENSQFKNWMLDEHWLSTHSHKQKQNIMKWNKNGKKNISKQNVQCAYTVHRTPYTKNIWNGTQWNGTDERHFMICEQNVKAIRLFCTEKCPSSEKENIFK